MTPFSHVASRPDNEVVPLGLDEPTKYWGCYVPSSGNWVRICDKKDSEWFSLAAISAAIAAQIEARAVGAMPMAVPKEISLPDLLSRARDRGLAGVRIYQSLTNWEDIRI
jgi:hypothetical protein